MSNQSMNQPENPEFELPKIPEPCDRSIVAEDYELSASDKPPHVTYKNITGLMLRYKVEESLIDITKTEFDTILKELNTDLNVSP